METAFWYGCALRAAGIPAGAVYAALRMMQWADRRHGFAVSYFERRRAGLRPDAAAMRLIDDNTLDGGGQSSLIAGPALLDRATVAAKAAGHATVTALRIGDLGWLGQLVEAAAKRGLAARLSFTAEGTDAGDLAAIYSAERTIIGLPGDPAPWWIETDAAGALAGPIVEAAPGSPGAVLTCIDPARHPEFGARVRAAARKARIAVATPEEIEASDRAKLRRGWPVDAAEWRSLAALGFNVLAESTERSRRSAGA